MDTVKKRIQEPTYFRLSNLIIKLQAESQNSYKFYSASSILVGREGVSEVMYFEVMVPSSNNQREIEIGYLSTAKNRMLTGTLRGNTLTLPATGINAGNSTTVHCEEVVGCGLLWPTKQIFFTADGIGTPVLYDLEMSEEVWSLEEIVPYFTERDLTLNFGQNSFFCHAMNSVMYRKNCCQLLYGIVLKSEDEEYQEGQL